MYIKSAEITNIRSIDNFKIDFENPAGWHVLIGDNGSGKSTIIRSLALALVGPNEARGLLVDWRDWLRNNESEGKIDLQIEPSADISIDEYPKEINNINDLVVPNILTFKKQSQSIKLESNINPLKGNISPYSYNWGEYNNGWFSAAYGPYRRFSGGDPRNKDVFDNRPKLGAHLSAFGEDVALTEAIEWLIKLNYQEVEKVLERLEEAKKKQFEKDASTVLDSGYIDLAYPNSGRSRHDLESDIEFFNIPLKSIEQSIVENLKALINSSKFLPNNTKLEKISSEGVFFKDGNGNLITVNQLSDGYRSILSLTFELIRQMIRVYGEKVVLKNIRENDMRITLPGVVLIDEIDAHLHPTWQTKIGQWFTKYFPNLQFIVTTHSPLVCRAAEKGTIWKLAAPGSDEKSEQIIGIERERLINGNVLDAYGTEAFGKNVSISDEASHKIERLSELNLKSIMGTTDDNEEQELQGLKAIYPTEKVK